MIPPRARGIALWSLSMAAALWIVVHARYITDLSAFLPAKPTISQQLLVDQLRDGPASRLILIALEAGDPQLRAAVSTKMAGRLRQDAAFADIENGAPLSAASDREFLFRHRYLLSDAVTAARFSVDGLRAALGDTIDNLASPLGLMLKELVPHDPTGEMLGIVERLEQRRGPATRDGVWLSADGARTLLVAQTVAVGSDTDAQERAIGAVRNAFDAALVDTASAPALRLMLSGPGVFAVAARTKIKTAATRLSIISSLLVTGVLLAVYRSLPALLLGLLPVLSGALCGIAAVAVGFGAVHGITLGFGITLIGESVDYSIYFFIQASRNTGAGDAPQSWRQALWPTIRLGMLASVCGFASLLPSGFPGLAQLGLYSISGLVAAALVTRFLLPELLPHGFNIRDVTPFGHRLQRMRDSLLTQGGRGIITGACIIAGLAILLLAARRDSVWNHELASLSPVSTTDLRYDATLRADLGTADVLDLVIVSGSSLEAVLAGAERAGGVLESLTGLNVIGGFETPAAYLPSRATQLARRDSLPPRQILLDNLRRASVGLALQSDQLIPFVDDVEAARQANPVTVDDLRGTSLAAGFSALVIHHSDRWSALLPLHAPTRDGRPATEINVPRVSAALAAVHLTDTRVLDLTAETDSLYRSYLREAMQLSLAGFVLIVLLLSVTLRSASRVLRVLLPLVLSVLTVAAGLTLFGRQLTLLHLVGMLLIVAVGSNYALFFDRQARLADDTMGALTFASLAIANVSTVIGFGLLSFSQVPVLIDLGTTVGPGAFLALLFSALLTPRSPGVRADA